MRIAQLAGIIFSLMLFGKTGVAQVCSDVDTSGCDIENPAEPTEIIPAPPLICPDGSFSDCNPVNDASCIPCGGNIADSDASELLFEIYPDSGLYNQFQTHIACEQNYYAAQTNIFQLYDVFGLAAPVVCNGPKISDFVDAVFACNRPVIQCDDVASWGGGNLWKPVSENTGNPVVLINSSFKGGTCDALDAQGNSVASCTFRPTGDGVNGGRAHFDVRSRCASLPDNLVFRAVKDGRSTCWEVRSPCSRLG